MPPPPPSRRGEGMTAAPPRACHHRHTPAMTSEMPKPPPNSRSHAATVFSAIQIVRRPAPSSRPYGRYAVGLRPNLDHDASPRRAPNPAEKNKDRSKTSLDRSRSFRDDLRKRKSGAVSLCPAVSGRLRRSTDVPVEYV